MNEFEKILEGLGIPANVRTLGPAAKFSTIHWGAEGYEHYCPRDILLVIGDQIIETPNVIRSRAQETFSYRTLLIDYMKSGAKWYSAPKPMLLDLLFQGVDLGKPTPRNDEPAFDAANVLCFGRDLTIGQRYRQRIRGSLAAGNFRGQISDPFPQRWEHGSHIDSTIVALRPGLILCQPCSC